MTVLRDGSPAMEEAAVGNQNFRVFVLSLPRCGSSMMTGICERLGVQMKYTTEDEEEVKKREESEKKRYGKDYRMNPKFYEITKNQFKHWHDIYETPFSGCKVIIPVGGIRLEAVLARPAKVIMMWRDPSEIRQSQEASYKKARANYGGRSAERRGAFIKAVSDVLLQFKPDADELDIENAAVEGFDKYIEATKPEEKEPYEHAESCLRTHLASTEVMLEARMKASNGARFDAKADVQPFDFKIVKYRDVLDNPQKKVAEIARFLQADPSLIDYAVSSIDPSRIRFKKEELVKGI